MPDYLTARLRPTTVAACLATNFPILGLAQPDGSARTLTPVEVRATLPEPNGRLSFDIPSSTGSRLGLTPRETPASVTVIDRETIDARGAQDTQEILRAIPGITAHNAPGNIGVTYRGFSGGSVTQLFNGINVQYTIAARPVDSWIYDRVEAIGGPSSFLFGAGAVGGTINYITKLAERQDLTEAQLRLGTEALREASFGINRRIAGEGNGSGDHYARVDFNHRSSNSWTEDTRRRATQLATSLLSDFGGGVSHTLAYELQDERVDRPYWGTPLLNPVTGKLAIDPATRFKNYNSSDGLYAQRVHWLRSISSWKLTDAASVLNTFYVYDALRDYRNVETYTFNAANTAVSRSAAFLQRHDQRLVGDKVEATYKGFLGQRRSDWAFGLDVSVNKQTRFPNSLPGVVSTVNPYTFATERFFDIPGMTPGFNADRDNRVTTIAAYAENRTELTKSVALVTALRHEQIELELTNRRAVTAALPASFERTYRPTTGRVGVVWQLTPETNLYAQYATAADPPSGILSTASFADVRTNSELTTGRQLEVGAKTDFWDRKGNASAAVFHIVRRNISTQELANPALMLLVGQQSSRGVELSAGVRATSRWTVQANFTYADAELDTFNQGGVSLAGNRPANTPAAVANVWTSYTLAPGWQANVGVRRVGRVFANNANTGTWPSYTLVDLGLTHQVGRNASLVARIRNATDRIYAANVGTLAYLGAPRTADIALRLTY